MMKDHDLDRIAKKLRDVSPSVDDVYAASPKDGVQRFHCWTTQMVTTDEMISICRDMAAVIRREIPERPDGWAASIYPGNELPVPVMGVYHVGWMGRSDEWHLNEGQERKATDHGDWLTFRGRLQAAVAALGIEGKRAGEGGDFKVSDHERGDEKGPFHQTLFVNNPEFLTKELIAAIQSVLRDGHANEVVEIFPAFGDPFKSLWAGLEIRRDSIVERWDRQQAEQLLGDRLRVPRYARDNS